MKQLFSLLLALSFAAFAPGVCAQEAPDAMVKRVTDEVLDIVRNDKEIQGGNAGKAAQLIHAKVLPYFNFSRMTALAVGKDWRRATPQQQERLIQEFKTLLVRTYANSLSAYKDQSVRYKPFKAGTEDEAVVRTEIVQPGGKPVPLDYNLEKQDGAWKVYDVTVAGVSLVTNYRDQFAQEVRSGGVDGLIKALVAKNAS